MENTKNFQELAAEAREMGLSLHRYDFVGIMIAELHDKEGVFQASMVAKEGYESVLLAMIVAAIDALKPKGPAPEQLEVTGVE